MIIYYHIWLYPSERNNANQKQHQTSTKKSSIRSTKSKKSVKPVAKTGAKSNSRKPRATTKTGKLRASAVKKLIQQEILPLETCFDQSN